MSGFDFEPMTPREALLAIRFAKLGQEDVTANPDWEMILAYTEAGLSPHSHRAGAEFELADTLADRLAEAHRVLAKLLVCGAWRTMGETLKDEINEALTLPPDLEAMVERRLR